MWGWDQTQGLMHAGQSLFVRMMCDTQTTELPHGVFSVTCPVVHPLRAFFQNSHNTLIEEAPLKKMLYLNAKLISFLKDLSRTSEMT